MNAIHKYKRVDRIEGAWLPFFYFRQYPVSDPADHFRMPAMAGFIFMPIFENLSFKCSYCESISHLSLISIQVSLITFSTSSLTTTLRYFVGNTKWYISFDALCDLCKTSLNLHFSFFLYIVSCFSILLKFACAPRGGECTHISFNLFFVWFTSSESFLHTLNLFNFFQTLLVYLFNIFTFHAVT